MSGRFGKDPLHHDVNHDGNETQMYAWEYIEDQESARITREKWEGGDHRAMLPKLIL